MLTLLLPFLEALMISPVGVPDESRLLLPMLTLLLPFLDALMISVVAVSGGEDWRKPLLLVLFPTVFAVVVGKSKGLSAKGSIGR